LALTSIYQMKKIAIVYGGFSAEAGISAKSAAVAKKFICANTYTTFMVRIGLTGWFLELEGESYPIDKNNFGAMVQGKPFLFDGVFIAIHGDPGENGVLQAYFDLIKMPYNTSGSFAAAMTFDKGSCNSILRQKGIKVAESYWYQKGIALDEEVILKRVGLPCFVKPNRGGSSYGISKVSKAEDLQKAINFALEHDSEVIIEAYVRGTEASCGCLNYIDGIKALPITEIVVEGEFFDYAAKYEGKSQEITPARLDLETTLKIQNTTELIYKMMQLNGMARVDYIIQDGEPFVIEINTVPGLSEESILPQQANAAGISMKDFFTKSLSFI
jgi:D-alanine-D-alanine ligase